MANLGDRIVVLIDMDCFYCQVEAKLNPQLKGKPLAVVQYSSFGPSSIIAVNYEARDFGVTRFMKAEEAREKCPEIQLVTVPPIREKPDTGRYRIAGKEVIEVMKQFCTIIERASIDEAYLDITDLVDKRLEKIADSPEDIIDHLANTFVVGYCDESNDEEQRREGVERWHAEAFDDLGDLQSRKLAVAGIIVEELRSEIYAQCEYRCSAGISYNKILAKLACGLHKPNKQTILATAAVPGLFSTLPVKKVRNLGGKFGKIVMESLGCNVMADLLRYSLQELQTRFDEKTGNWLYNIARGIDNEPVVSRLVCKSIGASKNFPGKQAITKLEVLQKWAGELAAELVDRLTQDMEENERRATSLTIGYHSYSQDKKGVSQTRVCPLPAYKVDRIASTCVNIVTKATQKPISFLSMSASKFVPVKGSGCFIKFFKVGQTQSVDETNRSSDVPKDSETNGIDNELLDATEEQTECHSSVNLDSNVEKSCREEESQNNQTRAENPPKSQPNRIELSPFFRKKTSKNTILTDNVKNSFFLNILKDSKNISSSSVSSSNEKECESTGSVHDESSNLFDDCEPEKNESATVSQVNGIKKIEQSKLDTNASISLHEIFPDLDNIDPSVVQLLPMDLQRQANAYLKSKKASQQSPPTKNTSKTQSTRGRPSKVKAIARKAIAKNTTFVNFFIKNVPENNDAPMKQCPECCQMVYESKFLQHSDFHVAQNMQRLINQTMASEAGLSDGCNKRKLGIDASTNDSKKSRNLL